MGIAGTVTPQRFRVARPQSTVRRLPSPQIPISESAILLQQLLAGRLIKLPAAAVPTLFRIGHAVRKEYAKTGAAILQQVPANRQVGLSEDIEWCMTVLEPQLAQLQNNHTALCQQLVADRIQITGLLPVATQELLAIVRHDLPHRLLSWLTSASTAIMRGRALSTMHRDALAAMNQPERDIASICQAALAEAAPELIRNGCSIAHPQVVQYGACNELTLHSYAQTIVTDALINFLTNGARRQRSEVPHAARRVTVSMHQLPGGALQIDVADNGIGVPTDRIGDLGKHGVMLKEVPAAGETGTGLFGVIQKGWLPLFLRVTCDANGNRCGSTFRYYLPSAVIEGHQTAGTTTWQDILAINAAQGFTMLPQSAHKAPPCSMEPL